MLDSVPTRRKRRLIANLPRSLAVLLLLTLGAAQADAQIARRNFINASFEAPDMDVACGATGTTWRPIDATIVPGWETTHSLWSPGNACGGPTPYRAIEFWESGFQGVNSLDGTQHVELNANESSRIYQFACLLANETVSYSYYHRARTGATEISRAVLYDENGAVLIDQGGDDPVVRASGWVQHNGTLTNDGSNGPRQIGFVAVNSGSLGNFLDLVELQLQPLVELLPLALLPVAEDAGTTLYLRFLVNGELDNAATFTLALDGSSTASPPDFSVTPGPLAGRGIIDSYSAVDGTITISLPAGTYDPNENDNSNGLQGQFDIPLDYTVDAQIEPDENIVYVPGAVLVGGGASAARDLTFDDANCDTTQTSSATLIIANDDVDLTITKTLDTPWPYQVGQVVQYTVVVGNLSPGAASATNVVVSDTPANLTIISVSSPNCSALPCTIPSLAPGSLEVITITATVETEGGFLNTATVSADQADQDPSNNSDLGRDRNNGGFINPVPVPALPLLFQLLLAIGLVITVRRGRSVFRNE